MSSRFSEFLVAEKIDPRRIIVASRSLERLRPEDRKIRLEKRLSKKKGDAAASPDKAEAKEVAKRRSGRAITPRLLKLAEAGGALSGAQKTRLVRALNRVLSQKQRDQVDLRKIF
jgi:ABC-type phosphate transport system auxiliary subunit